MTLQSIDAAKNYKEVSGTDIDSLWQVQDALARTPQWHSVYLPNRALAYDSDEDSPAFKAGKKPRKKVLAITNGEKSDDSMPELQSVSNSSDDDDSDDEESDADDDEDDDDSVYDEEQEDEIRDLLREAMDTAHEGDLFDRSQGNDDIDPFLRDGEDTGKGNAFLKLLGSLRGKLQAIRARSFLTWIPFVAGRVFNPSPKLKTKSGTPAPRNPKTGFFGKTKSGAPPPPKKPEPASTASDCHIL